MNNSPKLINQGNSDVIQINSDNFSVGRGQNCNYVLDSLGVSRNHCTLKKIEDKWQITDNSMNGTNVGKKILKKGESCILENGDSIKFVTETGDITLQFVTNDEPPTYSNKEKDKEIEVETAVASGINDQQKNVRKPANDLDDLGDMEEFSCAICSELFVKAATLQCAHSFCEYCIEMWRKTKSQCPICRKPILTVSPTLVLDNYIEKYVSSLSDDLKTARQELVKERLELRAAAASSGSSTSAQTVEIPTFDISDEDYMDEEDYDGAYSSSFDDEDMDYNGVPGHYYGGYGSCYSCGDRGHWANGFPNR